MLMFMMAPAMVLVNHIIIKIILSFNEKKPEGHHKAMIDVHKSKTEQVMQPKHQSEE